MRVKPSRRLRKHLEAHGRNATATVLEIAPRGWNEFRDERGWDAESHNFDPMRSWCRRETRIRVHGVDGSDVDTEAKLTFRAATLPDETGMEIDVVYDPADPSKVMVDDDGQMARLGQAEVGAAKGMIEEAGYNPEEALGTAEAVRSGEGLNDLMSGAMESAREAQARIAADPQGALRAMQEQQLDQLARLRDQGALTEADFEEARRRLMGE